MRIDELDDGIGSTHVVQTLLACFASCFYEKRKHSNVCNRDQIKWEVFSQVASFWMSFWRRNSSSSVCISNLPAKSDFYQKTLFAIFSPIYSLSSLTALLPLLHNRLGFQLLLVECFLATYSVATMKHAFFSYLQRQWSQFLSSFLVSLPDEDDLLLLQSSNDIKHFHVWSRSRRRTKKL